MKVTSWQLWICGIIILSIQVNAQNTNQKGKSNINQFPVIPIGFDAYRMWDQLPLQRIGARAYMRSTYDRFGGNEAADASHFLFANEDNLSRSIQSWNINNVPDQDVVDLISLAGTDIAPKNINIKSGKLKLNKKRLLLSNIKSSSSTIRALKLTLPLDKAIDLERLNLLVTWDNSQRPSIDVPLCLFFGAGTLYNRENKEYLVKGFPINIRYDYANNKVELSCYYPMPFFKSAQFEIASINPNDTEIHYEIRYEQNTIPPHLSSYFHATYQDIPEPELGIDMTFLDTRGVEGHDEWSGNFVGVSFIFSHNGVLNTLEGDPRFFFDDSKTPQAYGTGTEEWAGGGDYWGGQNTTLPFAGHPVGVGRNINEIKNEKDLIESAYRFLIADLMPFGRRAIIRFEHGAENLSNEHYESVTYWYGLPTPSLVKTDSIDIGDIASENNHSYYSPQASEIESISSRYEWDISPPSNTPTYMKEDGRHTQGFSEFTVKLDPDNLGVLLRRTLDYSFPNQTAVVYVSDVNEIITDNIEQKNDSKWEEAGIWYLAGSNTVFYSNPKGELEKRELRTKTSNCRFRDDEFLIPARLTKKRHEIRVRIKFIPDYQHLFPKFPFPKKSAWSELKYDVFSYVLPNFPLKNKSTNPK